MTRIASLQGGRRTQLRLPLSPLKAEMALKALEDWRPPAGEGREQGWYRITDQANAPAQINIYDEISWWGISAQQFVDDLAQISGPVEVHINSPGGDAFDGITIYNALAARDGVTTVVDGLAASAASVIFMAGATRVASPGSMVMIHDALALCIGNAADMRETAALLDKVSDNIASVYAAHTSMPAAQWRAAMVAEGWYTAQEAVDAGLAHELAGRAGAGSEPGTAPEAAFDRSVFTAWLGRPAAAAQPHSPMTGTHSHPHPAYASQGGDASHEHEHTHDGDASHQHSHDDGDGDDGAQDRTGAILGIESMPLVNKAIPVHHTATVDEAWDGPAAVAAMPAEYADLHYCHAWQDAEADASSHTPGDDDADDKKANYKFPHHRTQGGPANLAACRNGLARLPGADIPAGDDAGVKAHLQAHLDDAGGDGADDHAHIDFSGVDLEQLGNCLKEAIK